MARLGSPGRAGRAPWATVLSAVPAQPDPCSLLSCKAAGPPAHSLPRIVPPGCSSFLNPSHRHHQLGPTHDFDLLLEASRLLTQSCLGTSALAAGWLPGSPLPACLWAPGMCQLLKRRGLTRCPSPSPGTSLPLEPLPSPSPQSLCPMSSVPAGDTAVLVGYAFWPLPFRGRGSLRASECPRPGTAPGARWVGLGESTDGLDTRVRSVLGQVHLVDVRAESCRPLTWLSLGVCTSAWLCCPPLHPQNLLTTQVPPRSTCPSAPTR